MGTVVLDCVAPPTDPWSFCRLRRPTVGTVRIRGPLPQAFHEHEPGRQRADQQTSAQEHWIHH